MKKKRILCLRALVIAIAALVVAMDLAFLFSGSRAYSPTENRNLQRFPRLTPRMLASGRFESQFDSYVADQFPFRDSWIRAKATADRMLGRTQSGGVFLGRDGYLIQDFPAPDPDNYAETVDRLRSFSQRHADMPQYMLLAPSALTACKSLLPRHAPAGDESGYMDRLMGDLNGVPLRFIDVRGSFAARRADTQLYYRTDHHWTTDAAYIAYLTLSDAAGLSGGATAYRRALLTDGFSGTLTATSGFRASETDPIYAYLPETEVSYVVSYVEEGRRSATVYAPDCLEARDKYTVFFGGNHALVKLEMLSDSDRVLLVLKDSYANCFVPFLIPDYKAIVMVDPRYYTGDLETLMAAEGVTEVLFVYNANTFASDTSLKGDIS